MFFSMPRVFRRCERRVSVAARDSLLTPSPLAGAGPTRGLLLVGAAEKLDEETNLA
jgi:hypothetical protein